MRMLEGNKIGHGPLLQKWSQDVWPGQRNKRRDNLVECATSKKCQIMKTESKGQNSEEMGMEKP